MDHQINEKIKVLADIWCREYSALSIMLPAWLAVNGLTDGWGDLFLSVKQILANLRNQLPEKEIEALRDIAQVIDFTFLSRLSDESH